jgi:hypothetical protein
MSFKCSTLNTANEFWWVVVQIISPGIASQFRSYFQKIQNKLWEFCFSWLTVWMRNVSSPCRELNCNVVHMWSDQQKH